MSVPYESMVWLGQEEPQDLLMLQGLLQPGQTFVDCGANIGLWSLVAAKAVGAAGKVFSFEPNPCTYQRLEQNLAHNRLTDTVTPLRSACGSQIGETLFECNVQHNISHVAVTPASNTVLVPVTTLDFALADVPVAGIKIDVEGEELGVLKGAEDLLGRCRPWICVEFNPAFSQTPRLGNWDVHRHLVGREYHCRHFTEAVAGPELGEEWEAAGYSNLYYFPRT